LRTLYKYHYLLLTHFLTFTTFYLPELARVIDIYLDLHVMFDQKIFRGTAILTILKKPSVTEIVRKHLYFLY